MWRVQIDRNGSGWFAGPVEGVYRFFAGYPGSGGRDYYTNLNRSLNNLRWDLGVVGGGGSYPLRLAMGHATINVSSGLLNHATCADNYLTRPEGEFFYAFSYPPGLGNLINTSTLISTGRKFSRRLSIDV
jgi:hypothetical protein